MIYDKLSNFSKYTNIHDKFSIVLDFIKNNDLSVLPNGKTIISASVFLNKECYFGKNFIDNKFESHIKYIDIQLIIKGTEKHLFTTKLTNIIEKYEDKDLYFSLFNSFNELKLSQYEFVIYFPNEPHKPALKLNDEQITKIVFKIKA